jgi:hypothetical protein
MGAFDAPQLTPQQEAEFYKKKAQENYNYDPKDAGALNAALKYGADVGSQDDNFLTATGGGFGGTPFEQMILNAAGENKYLQALTESQQVYDPNSFEYGGSQAAGDSETHRLNQMAGYMRTSRQSPVIDQTGMNASLAQALAARGQQAEAAGMFQQAGAGQGPTAAPAQMNLANALATGQGQQMLANGPRGPAGAAAMRAAALQGTGQAMQQNAMQAGSMRAGEQFAGMGGYQGTANAMFGGDMRGAQTAANMAGAQADIGAQMQGQNDAMERYFSAQRAQALAAQQQGRIAREGFQQQQVHNTASVKGKADIASAERSQRAYEDGSRMISAGIGAMGAYADGKGKK